MQANTTGCTKEVCAFRDEYTRFEQVGAQVLGISGDSPAKLADFAQVRSPVMCWMHFEMPFFMVMHETHALCELFSCLLKLRPLCMCLTMRDFLRMKIFTTVQRVWRLA